MKAVREQQEDRAIEDVILQIAKELGRSREEVYPFIERLAKNWVTTLSQYQRLPVPKRKHLELPLLLEQRLEELSVSLTHATTFTSHSLPAEEHEGTTCLLRPKISDLFNYCPKITRRGTRILHWCWQIQHKYHLLCGRPGLWVS